MIVLCLGHSRIVQRKVLPALRGLAAVSGLEVASRRGAPALDGVRGWGDFEQALAESPAELVYVSTDNADHAPWVARCLEAGKHVVVDKPAVLDPADAERLVEVARARGLLLAEAVVYAAHPQLAACREAFAAAESPITRALCAFTMPPLDPANFRYRADRGGGAIYDLAPYAVSLGRLLFGAAPERIDAAVTARGAEVELGFSALLRYPGGRTVVGQLGFDGEYQNWLTLIGPGAAAHVERVFTTPPELANTIRVRASNQGREVTAPAADAFAAFLEPALAAAAGGDHAAYAEALLEDARAVAQLRRAAGMVA